MNAAALAAATLAAGSCRVRIARYGIVDEGVADLDRRVCRLETVERPESFDRLAEHIAERFPWLDDGPVGPPAPTVTPERTVRGNNERARPHSDPLWILELLTMSGAIERDFRIDLAKLDVEPGPHSGSAPPVLYGIVTGEDRISRVEWRRVDRVRLRARRQPEDQLVVTVDFWDYGIPVDIDVPEPAPPVRIRDVVQGLRELRRRKRAWERRSGA